MRVLFTLFALVGAVVPIACSDVMPSEPLTVPMFASKPTPGTGNPAADAQLQNFNNQVVVCANTNQLEPKRASHMALLTSVVRFTPGSNGNKASAIVGALGNQIDQAERKDEISPACAAQLRATLASLEAML